MSDVLSVFHGCLKYLIESNVTHAQIKELVRSHILTLHSVNTLPTLVLYSSYGADPSFCDEFVNLVMNSTMSVSVPVFLYFSSCVSGSGSGSGSDGGIPFDSVRDKTEIHVIIQTLGNKLVKLCPHLFAYVYYVEYANFSSIVGIPRIAQLTKQLKKWQESELFQSHHRRNFLNTLNDKCDQKLFQAFAYQNEIDLESIACVHQMFQDLGLHSWYICDNVASYIYDPFTNVFVTVPSQTVQRICMRIGLMAAGNPWCNLSVAKVPGLLDWKVLKNADGSETVIF